MAHISDILNMEDIIETTTDSKSEEPEESFAENNISPRVIILWHNRLGHTATKTEIKKLLQQQVQPKMGSPTLNCIPCVHGTFRFLNI